jgi:hypothetical protein
MLGAVLAWLWPIGLVGKMPVGGDATQFSMGLMAFLKIAIEARRLPLWNDLWGFGFPGVAESQMGVFYPPHLILYGSLPTESAYLASLVLHTLWAALGAFWAARKFGGSEVGSALAGFVWATSGFFLIHLPHQWGYTVGSWMPWAWGLTWQICRGEGNRRTPWLLSAVLALQVLPGHFQLAFTTEVGSLVIALVGGGRSVGRRVVVILALGSMIPLAAMQLWPTYELAQLSDAHRDFEYLSGFAATPIHLVNYVAPGLFHRSPLWRPLAWDPFHTSPEELLSFVGLVPLFLGLAAIRRGILGDSAIRTLAVVGVVTVIFSFGPYVPGFSNLIRLPGFSFFRAPARWTLATNLALALLAGRGFDAWRTWPKPDRAVRRFVLVSLGLIALVVGGFELALASAKGEKANAIASIFDRANQLLPWADRPESKPFRSIMAEAYRPQFDSRTQASLGRLDGKPPEPPGPTLANQRFGIYGLELVESGGLLGAILVLSFLTRRPKIFASGLLILTLADALLQARHRPFDLGSSRPLIDQSSVLARLAKEPRGTRTLDPAQNLFMVAGVAPVSAYRTLDLPSPGRLLQVARGPLDDRRVIDALRIAGVGLRVLDPIETKGLRTSGREEITAKLVVVDDPALAGWLFGDDLARSTGWREFGIVPATTEPPRAWVFPAKGLIEFDLFADPLAMIDRFRLASPLPYRSVNPENAEVDVRVVDPNPLMVVVSRTYDPEWQAVWTSESGETRPGQVVKVLGGWQGVAIPGPGRWTLKLEYPGKAVWMGLAIGSTAWSFWLMGYLGAMMGKRRVVVNQPKVEIQA